MTTRLINDRETALKIGFNATDWGQPVDYSIYEKVMQDWDVKALMRNDECIGAVYFKDGEVHASVLPEWRKKWATKSILQEMFAHPNACTRISKGHEYMHGILNRIGLVQDDSGYFVKEF